MKRLGITAVAVILLAIFISFPALADGAITSLEDCAGKRVGVLTGSILDTAVQEHCPEAVPQYFTNVSDEVTALLSGAIDAFSCDVLTARSLMAEHPQFCYLDEPLGGIPTGYAFAKDECGAKLCSQLSEYLAVLESDGRLDKLQDKWLSIGAGDYALDMSGLDPDAETLVFATSCSGKPNSYYYEGKPTGYELEIAVMFCREYGYNIDIQIVDFAGIIPGLVGGKYDFANDGIAITEERSKSVNFSSPDYNSAIVMVTLRANNEDSSFKTLTSVSQINDPDVRLGMVTGSAFDETYAEVAPEAEIMYYNTSTDMIFALKNGQIDGFIYDEPLARYIIAHNEGITDTGEYVGDPVTVGFVFGKTPFGEKLRGEFDEYLEKIRADGTLDEMCASWCEGENEATTVEFPAEGKNGTVRIAAEAAVAPIVYLNKGEMTGLEMDMLARFCREYGYAMEADDLNFAAIIPSVVAERHDIAAGYFYITPERAEVVNFSEPYITSGNVLLVRAPYEEKTFWQGVKESFIRTFIREDRWKLIVKGIGTTMFISVCAALLGTLLAFGLCLLRRTGSRIVNIVITVYIRIMQGTPLLVILMILYYIVFARSGMSGELVAICAFAMNFAAYVCEIFVSGIEAVDRGQREAALALGYTRRQAFMQIVMPQAAMHFLPVYKGEFISMVKMTSIVGYIAVQDLTRMSDIIRSRTYEAFFPLIATAVIYFLLSAALTAILRAIEIKIEPDRVNRSVKGVTMK